jgi:hypothetical protein
MSLSGRIKMSEKARRAGMALDDPVTETTLQRLRDVRQALLHLHKILLEYQRELWERSGGKIANSYELLELVLHHPEFAWLHQLSELVVQIDELLDELKAEDVRPTERVAQSLLEQAGILITPAETGDDFRMRYFEALQNSPDVVLAHSEVVKLLGKRITEVH